MKSTSKACRILVLTGPRRTGKTTWMLGFADFLRRSGQEVFGVATPKLQEGGRIVGIAVRDLQTLRETPLAVLDDLPGTRVGPWRFLKEGLALANAACDPESHEGICMVDEIGPLEMRGEGFMTAMEALKGGRYPKAVVCVREELLTEAKALFAATVSVIRREADPDYDEAAAAL